MAKPKSRKSTARVAAATTISAWEQDPGSGANPDGGPLIQRPVPKLANAPFPLLIQHPSPAPKAKVYSPGSSGFRYWTAAEAMRRGADFWGGLLPGQAWEVGARLPVDLDHGSDLNAYYDRVGLRFFHGSAGGRTVYSGESADVVCHELGHAILDSIKPQLWDAAALEVAAFHESFGDMSALLSALQLPSLRAGVLTETGGVLYRSSRLSRLAEQLGWAIRQVAPTAVEADCLRNAVNAFVYRPPGTLPSSGPASQLSAEPHSFSRVFTGAFFEGLGGMFASLTTRDEHGLLQVSGDAGRILVDAIKAVSVVPSFYAQVAAGMVDVAGNAFKTTGYAQALRSAFVRHGILAPGADLRPASKVATKSAKGLSRASLPGAEFGLGVDAIVVMTAGDGHRFDVTGAAVGKGSVAAPEPDDAARMFLEHLVRRGRLSTASVGRRRAEVLRPDTSDTHDSHTHELRREGSEVVLRRVRIDCGPCCG